jgi:hypothetical protein
VARHILTGFIAFATLEWFLIVDLSIHYRLFEFLYAVEVGNWILFLIVLN